MIPAESISEGGDEGLRLLAALSIVHLATGFLAMKRESPSIAGITVLAPWLWMFVHTLWISSLESFSEARDISVDLFIVLEPKFVAIYLTLAALIQYPINMKLGDTGVNIAGKLIGATELSARLRDSGLMRLWNLGLLAGLAVWLMFIDGRDNIGWYTLVGISSLAIVHIAAEVQDRHQSNPRFILFCLALTFAIIQWNFGADVFWIVILTGSSIAILLTRGEDGPGSQLLGLTMGLLTLQIVLFGLDNSRPFPLIDPEVERVYTGFVMLFATGGLLAVYLPRAGKLEKLLQPAIAAVCLLTAQIWAAAAEDMNITQPLIAGAIFVGAAIYLAATGELRMELKQVGKRESRLAEIQRRRALAAALEKGTVIQPDNDVKLLAETSGTANPTSAMAVVAERPEQALDVAQSGKMYHFADESLASKAADDPTGALAKSMSQAISRGGMKVADAELYKLIDKQRKRRRKSGAQYGSDDLDLLIGDIHHRPVIVLSFIVVTTFAACWVAWASSTLNPGLMLMVSLFALSLTWVSRHRAKVQNLRLPDINGVEMPFFVTMGSLALIYLVGHLGPGASKYKQLDLLVLTFGLLGLALISLYGREDKPWRIPSAVEAVITMLVLIRVLGAFSVNAVPFPFTVNPLDMNCNPLENCPMSELISWQLPWIFHEITLLLLVLIWEWMEGFRRTHNMPDHRGAAGRGTFALMAVVISAGPAGLLAGILCMRRSFDWKQPAAVAISVYAILGGLFAFQVWTDSSTFDDVLRWTLFAVGVTMVLAHVYTVYANMPKWTTAWLWNAHLILPVGVFAVLSPVTIAGDGSFIFDSSKLIWLIVTVFLLSLVTWVGGILQLRRGMRVMGALDLVISLCLALLIMKDGLLEPISLLIILVALGFELSIVAWLGARHDVQLAQD